MREIYQHAPVLIWLGEHNARRDFAGFTEMLQSAAAEYADAYEDLQQSRLHDLFCASAKPTKLTEWLLEVAQLPWFSRLWVRQEAALAIDRTFHLGQSSFKFEHLEAMMLLLDRYVYGNSEIHEPCKALLEDVRFSKVPTRMFKAAKMVRDLQSALSQHDFWIVKQNCTGLHTDPRDVIYGVCGLFEMPHLYGVDYRLPLGEVFRRFTLHCIKRHKTLAVLELLGNYLRSENSGQTEPQRREARPSWVPDFSLDSRTIYDYTKDPGRKVSCLSTEAIVLSESPTHTVRLKGIIVDILTATTEQALPSAGDDNRSWDSRRRTQVEKIVLEWEALASSLHSYPGGASIWIAFIETMLRGRNRLGTYLISAPIIRTMIPGFQQYSDINHEILLRFALPWYRKYCKGLLAPPSTGANATSKATDALADIFMKIAWFDNSSKRMFVTGKGYLGTGPSSVREGDVVCVFHGGRIPFILRPVADDPRGYFTCIGGVYIHGMMQGEVMSMPGLEAREITLL
ncbi:hypothetical protein MBLNU457_7391t1 [Dothideomycetes sp. NU457]